MKRLLFAMFILLLTLCACGMEDTADTLGTNPLEWQIGGEPDDVVEVCDIADLAGKDVSYAPAGDLRSMLDEPGFLSELQESISIMLAASSEYMLNDAEGCFLSLRELTAFHIGEQKCATAFYCYLFDRDMEPVGEILFYSQDGTLLHNSPVLYRANYAPYYLRVMAEVPDREHILLTNGYEEMLLDEDNQGHGNYGAAFVVVGDYFHALDWENMAVSYQEITAEENMVWLPFA